MTKRESASSELKNAMEILKKARGVTVNLKDLEKLAIELASCMLKEANQTMTQEEKEIQGELSRMMRDPVGKVFTTSMTDQCFRSKRHSRIADQLVYLLGLLGVPSYLGWSKRFSLGVFQAFGKRFSWFFVPTAMWTLRRATARVILPGEKRALQAHMAKRRLEGVRLNLNHLGEAILGEREAERRLSVYLQDLEHEEIEYISVKISTIYSQIHLIGWEHTLEVLSERLKKLYRKAQQHRFKRADGTEVPKFVNLDMEEYRDLHLTKELFKRVLSEPEFLSFAAGIVLQAYLPDAYEIQKELTEWAILRFKVGGAPIKIRIVKGANLAMEQFEASLRNWPQAPYRKKGEVDANYKRMVTYGCKPLHAEAVHLGIASHNLFDIAYALLLRAEMRVEKEINFEMLEGMADHMRRVVQQLSQDILLYCPVATKEDFQSAIAYLIRRLDENTGADNFLRVTFGLQPGTLEWEEQVLLFRTSCTEMEGVEYQPRRFQNRELPPCHLRGEDPFENEADTDFSLACNRVFAEQVVERWRSCPIPPIPLVLGGKEIHHPRPEGEGEDPSMPGSVAYRFSQATSEEADLAVRSLREEMSRWQQVSVEERCRLLSKVAEKMREKRGDLIGAMMRDGGKTILEGDPEVSEAIDFAEYYMRSLKKMTACKTLAWQSKGVVLVTPPWNFPIAIPAGGILAALAAGNCVLFKPAPEAVLCGWELVKLLWEAGVPRAVLQFINCADTPVGSQLIADPRIDCIILTGATSTAELFMRLRPGVDLFAETGGKNAIIATALSDRDLAIKDVVSSAFGHNGQKCSACSLLVLEKEVYEDRHFLETLKDAVESLSVGSCWDLSTKITSLIHAPNETLLRGLTTLEPGESWLVRPQVHPENPALWSPGVKLGVKKGSFSHKTEFFGPLLSVICAKDLKEALEISNGTPYGLTAGLQSLDEREKEIWMEKVEAGNCYINRGITGAIVRRQPFGGTKGSSFGKGAKAGGPSYVMQFAHAKELRLPQEKAPLNPLVNQLNALVQKYSFSSDELGIWYASCANYAFWAKRFAQDHDPSKLIGQDNLLRYRPHRGLCLRIQEKDRPLDLLRSLAAILSIDASVTISWDFKRVHPHLKDHLHKVAEHFVFAEESEEEFCKRVLQGSYRRVRLMSPASLALSEVASRSATFLDATPLLSHGRFELLHYLREISFSIDYHRYGNLGLREKEERKALH